MHLRAFEQDVELRRIEPANNRFRVYGLSVCTTLFGEPCLRIGWGRMGHRPLRERSETFASVDALFVRRAELLERRRRHRYTPVGVTWELLLGANDASHAPDRQDSATALERDIVESRGLSLADHMARVLVARLHAAATDLRRYVRARGADLDLEDVSTLALMYHDVA